MSDARPSSDAIVGTFELDGRPYEARARIAWDGVEFVARIFFHDLVSQLREHAGVVS